MPKKANKKILVVEDDADFLSILQTKLSSEGFLVVVARDGQEGLAATEKEKPDLIFTDILMPVLDGIQMAQKIRQTDKDVIIVFLTNLQDAKNPENSAALEEFEYLIKADTRINDIVKKAKEKLGIK